MIILLILSLILLWIHVSSLRFILRVSNNQSALGDAKKLEELIPESEKEFSLESFSTLFSLGIIFFLNLIEIGYFIFCVYFFNDFIITIGSSILAGYTIYSFAKFLPNIKKFFRKPFEYLKEKTKGFDNILNFAMTSLEILFCGYVLVRIMFKYRSLF